MEESKATRPMLFLRENSDFTSELISGMGRFGAAVLAPGRFGAGRFGAGTFWRRDVNFQKLG